MMLSELITRCIFEQTDLESSSITSKISGWELVQYADDCDGTDFQSDT